MRWLTGATRKWIAWNGLVGRHSQFCMEQSARARRTPPLPLSPGRVLCKQHTAYAGITTAYVVLWHAGVQLATLSRSMPLAWVWAMHAWFTYI